MTVSTDALLLEVARCPNILACFEGTDLSHPCAKVVADQRAAFDDFHVPEPWNGQIETAPILFVCWNPSWNRHERFPTHLWSDEAIIEFFRTRFDQSDQASRTWVEMRAIAKRLLGRPARPGVDYVVTDAVRCKSHGGKGASRALSECSGRYLQRTLAMSGARVVIALGKDARKTLATYFGVKEQIGVYGPMSIVDHERMLVQLGAPGSPDRRTLSEEESQEVQAVLA